MKIAKISSFQGSDNDPKNPSSPVYQPDQGYGSGKMSFQNSFSLKIGAYVGSWKFVFTTSKNKIKWAIMADTDL